MKIAISVETMADLSAEVIEKYDLKVIPFSVLLGDKTYLDSEITADDIIKFVDENNILPKTSAINNYSYETFFNELLNDYDAVIHFSVSSKLSSSCFNAKTVAASMQNVYVVDTLTLSTGIALLALYACDLRKEGLDAKTIYEKCLRRVDYVQVSFALKRIDYLYKGGRCNMLSYLGANILKIRPQIILKDGKMVGGKKKYRGNFLHVVDKYCSDILEEYNNPDLTRAFFTYTTATQEIKDCVINHLKERGFKDIIVTRTGGTITSHCGEECMGILFINDGDMIQ